MFRQRAITSARTRNGAAPARRRRRSHWRQLGTLVLLLAGSAGAAPPPVPRIIVYAAEPSGFGAAGFGHLLLRLADSDPFPENDLVAQFCAAVPAGTRLNPWRGIIGGYALTCEIRTFAAVQRHYCIEQNRALAPALQLKVSDAQALRIQQQLLAARNGHFGPYRFFTRNCASAMLELLEGVIGRKLGQFPRRQLPLLVPGSLLKAGLVQAELATVPSRQQQLRELARTQRTAWRRVSDPRRARRVQARLDSRRDLLKAEGILLLTRWLQTAEPRDRQALRRIAELAYQMYRLNPAPAPVLSTALMAMCDQAVALP